VRIVIDVDADMSLETAQQITLGIFLLTRLDVKIEEIPHDVGLLTLVGAEEEHEARRIASSSPYLSEEERGELGFFS
jgi:hypothetical protein